MSHSSSRAGRATSEPNSGKDQDPTVAYIRSFHNYPPKLEHEEFLLWHRRCMEAAPGSPARRRAQTVIVCTMIRFVRIFVRRFVNQGVPLVDLLQSGTIGVLRAIEKFDPSKNFHFTTYARWWIMTSIRDCLRWNQDDRAFRLPVRFRRELARMRRAVDVIAIREGRRPEHDELCAIAATVGSSMEDNVQLLVFELYHSRPLSLDRTFPGNPATLADRIRDSRPSAEELVGAAEEQSLIESSLAQLSERDAMVIRLRFGIGPEGPMTLSEVGKRLGVGRERARQIEARGLRQMREWLQGKGIDLFPCRGR